MNKIIKHLKKHNDYLYSAVLIFTCIAIYFFHTSDYAFIDNHETKYVSIAKEMLNCADWVNIRLNGVNLLNLQPLFFLITNFCCFLFGKITAEVMRLPVSFISVAAIVLIFKLLRNTLTNMYAFMISAVTATGLGMLIFSHLATNDMPAVVFIMLSVLFAQKILLVKEFDKVYTRLFIFLFSALATLTCGIFGLLIPFFSILIMNIFSGELKQLFAPKNFLPGAVLYLILVLPWNIFMFYKYGFDFLSENLKVCNFMNSFGLKENGFVIAAFVIGFLPWSFSFIWSLFSKTDDILQSFISYFKDNSESGLKEKWNKLNKINRFISLNTIFFFTSFIFALLYGSRNIYLVLLLLFPASCIAGYYWYQYIVRREHNGSIFFATIIPYFILIICSVIGIFGHNAINKYVIQGMNTLIVPVIIIFCVIPVVAVFAVIMKGRKIPFIANIILMVSLAICGTPDAFNLVTLNSGENDLISFAGIADEAGVELAAYIPEKKYSLVYYYDKQIQYIEYGDINNLIKYANEHPMTHIVTDIKDMGKADKAGMKYMLLDSGKRYCVIQKMSPDVEKHESSEEEPEVIIL